MLPRHCSRFVNTSVGYSLALKSSSGPPTVVEANESRSLPIFFFRHILSIISATEKNNWLFYHGSWDEPWPSDNFLSDRTSDKVTRDVMSYLQISAVVERSNTFLVQTTTLAMAGQFTRLNLNNTVPRP